MAAEQKRLWKINLTMILISWQIGSKNLSSRNSKGKVYRWTRSNHRDKHRRQSVSFRISSDEEDSSTYSVSSSTASAISFGWAYQTHQLHHKKKKPRRGKRRRKTMDATTISDSESLEQNMVINRSKTSLTPDCVSVTPPTPHTHLPHQWI